MYLVAGSSEKSFCIPQLWFRFCNYVHITMEWLILNELCNFQMHTIIMREIKSLKFFLWIFFKLALKILVCCFVVQSFSLVGLFVTPWTAAHRNFLYCTISWNLLKLMSNESVMSSNRLILCHPLLFLHSIFLSIRVFSIEPALCIRWPKYWCFSFSISPSNEYSGLFPFKIDWFDLLAVQGTHKNLHQRSKAPILLRLAFLMVQLSHLYMTTGKTIALIMWTFVGKEIYLLFNMLHFSLSIHRYISIITLKILATSVKIHWYACLGLEKRNKKKIP